jgi:tRNA modification GTPase
MNIYALSSGRGPSGIGIIRLSGKGTYEISKSILKHTKIKSKEVNLCNFYNPKNGDLIDEGLFLWFPGPNSYTGDDLAEFHIHGSNAVIVYFLQVLSEQKDCRLAEPGEFTKTAFLNNKIDLVKAESIGDLIQAETELQRQQAIKLVQGKASEHYNLLRQKLVKSLAYIEAQIDFAEDDLPESLLIEVQKSIVEVQAEIKKILEDHKVGEKIRDGFKVSIIGDVNVGKSSLLNLLSKREAAIVSEEKGTTRDIIETYLNIDGYPVILSDTAGIRDTDNKVEKKGIEMAMNSLKEADLNIIMLDNSSQKINLKIKDLINKDCIVVLNKSDLCKNKTHNFDQHDSILISVKENKNIDQLIQKIKDKLNIKFTSASTILISRERHRFKLNACLKEIDNFLKKNQTKHIELAAEDLRQATKCLSEIVGKVDVEEILGSIFSDFCIGK